MTDRPSSYDSKSREDWERTVLEPARARAPERAVSFKTASGRDVAPVYTPEDIAGLDYSTDIGDPGSFPFTRGVNADEAEGRPWTMRQAVALRSPASTNARLKALIAAGATGLEIDFGRASTIDPGDAHTDRDAAPTSVSNLTSGDMRTLLEGVLPHQDVAVSLAATSSAPAVFATCLAAAEVLGARWSELNGSLAHDALQSRIVGPNLLGPLPSSIDLAADLVVFASRHVPGWRGLEVSGVLMRDAGATAEQELSFTIANGIAYMTACVGAGLEAEAFTPAVCFSFGVGRDFFEEIAKLRAARRVWAHVVRQRFGARTKAGCGMRIHARTLGGDSSVTESFDDVVRTTYQALAAALGGANSLQTNGRGDVGPTEDGDLLALRTQQILAHEVGLASAIDPFGGSWWLERLTRDMVDRTLADIDEIDRLGGMVAAIEAGVPQRRIAESAAARGVTTTSAGRAESAGELAAAHDATAGDGRLRVDGSAQRALDQLARLAGGATGVTAALVECARAGATVGQMSSALRGDSGGPAIE